MGGFEGCFVIEECMFGYLSVMNVLGKELIILNGEFFWKFGCDVVYRLV